MATSKAAEAEVVKGAAVVATRVAAIKAAEMAATTKAAATATRAVAKAAATRAAIRAVPIKVMGPARAVVVGAEEAVAAAAVASPKTM